MVNLVKRLSKNENIAVKDSFENSVDIVNIRQSARRTGKVRSDNESDDKFIRLNQTLSSYICIVLYPLFVMYSLFCYFVIFCY